MEGGEEEGREGEGGEGFGGNESRYSCAKRLYSLSTSESGVTWAVRVDVGVCVGVCRCM